jgi:hypothetical protein
MEGIMAHSHIPLNEDCRNSRYEYVHDPQQTLRNGPSSQDVHSATGQINLEIITSQ